ncbi:MAG: PspC domain-containing protein [Bacteroidetes bacterium]|nr:MAG: PspC domain-containing protein [Bacteroidota bacterium]
MDTNSRLYRSTTNKVIGGVSGGLGDYLNIDPVIVRIVFVLLAVFGGSGVLVYIILWIVIPEQKYLFGTNINKDEKVEVDIESVINAKNKKRNSSLIAGIVLIAFGLLILMDRLIPMYNLWDFWPLLLVAAGVILIKPELFSSSKNVKS